MKDGRPLGPIDMTIVAAAKDAAYFDALPEITVSSVFKVSREACQAIAADHGEQELAEALFEYITILAFDMNRASNAEQVRWLFSNPGRFNDNLARVNAFESLLGDEVFRNDFVSRVNSRVMADLSAEITADVALSFLSGVVSETLAQHYDAQGNQRAAAFTRKWMEPMVDISLVLDGASSASTTGAGVGAALIWAKNSYAFWHLGEKQFRAEQTGASGDQQLERLAAEIESYTRTLISGRLTGVAFEGIEGALLTERHAAVIKSVLGGHYEMQQYWLSSDDAMLLETLDVVLDAARVFYESSGRLAEPTPLYAADSSGALPADLQGQSLQPAPNGFIGSPTTDGNVTATADSVAQQPNAEVGAVGDFDTGGWNMWVVLAFRQTLREAREFVATAEAGLRIFRTQNDWFVIASGPLAEPDYEGDGLASIIAYKKWPSDSLLSRGANFVAEYPLVKGGGPSASGVHTYENQRCDKHSFPINAGWHTCV